MFSGKTLQKLNQLHQTQDNYEPKLAIADRLASKTIVMLVGATGEGKNTVMDAIVNLGQRFHVTGNRTSRDPRDDDEPGRYVYIPRTDRDLHRVCKAIERHKVVQYAINPYSHLLYYTTLDDYRTEFNIADVFSSLIDNFHRLGFRNAFTITLVSDPDVWLERFTMRFPHNDPERQARRDEAIESLTWSLSQKHDHFWVHNIDGSPEVAAQTIIQICQGKSHGNPSASQLAAGSLEVAQNIAI